MDSETDEQKMERAIGLHQQGNLDAADALYREVLRAVPGHAGALHLAGVIAHQRGRHREAVDLIESALAGGASTAAIYTNCGVAYRALGELDNAASKIAWAIALDPEFAEAHFNYALVMLDQGLKQQAAEHLEIVRTLRRNEPKTYFYLAHLRLEEDRPETAASLLRECLQLHPGFADAQYLLARALLALGDTRGALQWLDAYLKQEPESAPAAYLVAKTGFELCHESAALAQFDQALRKWPEPDDRCALHAERARLGQIEPWCAARGSSYTRLARPQWLQLPQPKTLPADESAHFSLPKAFALEIFLARVDAVRVLPQDLLLLTADGRLFLDGLVSFPLQYAQRERTAIRHCADDGRLLLALPDRRVVQDAPCVWLGAGSGHFQWVFDTLARLWAIEQQPGLRDFPMVVQAGLTHWQEELLHLLGYSSERRIEVPPDAMLECRELYAASLVSTGYILSPVAIQHLRRELARRVPAATTAPRRIYLSRQGAATRRLANEAELLPLLEEHGFVTVHAERMSAAEQLALFQSAEFILGIEQAALVNLVVAPSHARVGVIVTRGLYQLRCYYLAAPIGQDFSYLCAEPDYASHEVLAECDVRLAPEVLREFLVGCRAAS